RTPYPVSRLVRSVESLGEFIGAFARTHPALCDRFAHRFGLVVGENSRDFEERPLASDPFYRVGKALVLAFSAGETFVGLVVQPDRLRPHMHTNVCIRLERFRPSNSLVELLDVWT